MSPVALLLGAFVALLVLRVPVAFSLILSSALLVYIEGLRFDLLIQQMYRGLNSFTLLAVPFFLLAGQLLNSGQITERLMAFAHALVGWIRGGLAHINVMVSMIFAGMSGSSTADTAGVGSVVIPQMIRRGFSREFTIAITAASSTMGTIIPPSILMVVYGAQTGVSIGALFLAGAIPGVLVGVAQMTYSYWYAVRNGIQAEVRPSVAEFTLSFRRAILPLFVPIIVIGGVLSGQFTATEAGMIAVMYVLVLMLVIYRTTKISALPRILSSAAVLYSQPLLAIAAAMPFGWLLAYYRAPDLILGLAGGIVGSPELTLLAVVSLFIVIGTFLDAIPAIIIFMPVVSKLIEASGAHPIQAGIVVIMTLALGLITPPYGLCLLIASSIGRVPALKVLPAIFPFYALFLLVVALVILFEDIALFLPRLLMPQLGI
jgi:tripartite ATP-independent transporter DctM subunit